MPKNSLYDLILINTQNGKKIVPIDKVIYLKAYYKYTQIYLSDSETLIARHLLKWFEPQFSKPQFFRCHKSYLINFAYLEGYSHNIINLKGGNLIKLSRNCSDLFKENYASYIKNLNINEAHPNLK